MPFCPRCGFVVDKVVEVKGHTYPHLCLRCLKDNIRELKSMLHWLFPYGSCRYGYSIEEVRYWDRKIRELERLLEEK